MTLMVTIRPKNLLRHLNFTATILPRQLQFRGFWEHDLVKFYHVMGRIIRISCTFEVCSPALMILHS